MEARNQEADIVGSKSYVFVAKSSYWQERGVAGRRKNARLSNLDVAV
jgi:hypothetical protein